MEEISDDEIMQAVAEFKFEHPDLTLAEIVFDVPHKILPEISLYRKREAICRAKRKGKIM